MNIHKLAVKASQEKYCQARRFLLAQPKQLDYGLKRLARLCKNSQARHRALQTRPLSSLFSVVGLLSECLSCQALFCVGFFCQFISYFILIFEEWLMIIVVISHKHTQMSSSYSSLDRVLSHWAHFTVRRFICVHLCVFCVFLFHTAQLCYCEHSGVDLMGLKPNPQDLYLPSVL